MAHDRVRRDAPFKTRLDNNGQRSNLVRAGYDVNDLKRTFVAPILRFLPHG